LNRIAEACLLGMTLLLMAGCAVNQALNEKEFNHMVDYLRLLRAVGLLDLRLTPLPPEDGPDAAGRGSSSGSTTSASAVP